MKNSLRMAVLVGMAAVGIGLSPVIRAAVHRDPGVIVVTVDVSAYLGRSLHFFAGTSGGFSPFLLPSGQRVVVPLVGSVDDLGTVFVQKSRARFAVDARLVPRGARVAVAAVAASAVTNPSTGRAPVAQLVAEIDQEPAPTSR
ncbi:MAG: hypothetical protein HYR85_00735 [Planctomycetes bacterium]|nr:hypothetical protein [Planctomycetota bacterium]MBI3847489.1 hypothetical protein [Planctomycetota bacterium]